MLSGMPRKRAVGGSGAMNLQDQRHWTKPGFGLQVSTAMTLKASSRAGKIRLQVRMASKYSTFATQGLEGTLIDDVIAHVSGVSGKGQYSAECRVKWDIGGGNTYRARNDMAAAPGNQGCAGLSGGGTSDTIDFR
eukprot:CAMPEP_0117556676 /NCGR_PEP_ID=MMETSP0784-20121206/51933_1 /TAXON_ID=39447 /ORGANISM="" /LENGTH=134 /DNA_ID=CAMNT_0005353961 /DNA_START=328 /DNA_END=731 /DNA_ORIENTATION=+